LSAERCKHMGAPRSRRRKLCLLSTTVRPDPWPSRGRQLNLIFGSFRGCKSRFYADFRLFSENCCGGTPAGMEVFPEMGGMPAILVACTLRSRPCAGTPPACHQSLPVAPAAPPPTHAAHPSFTGSVTIIGPATGRRKGVFGGTLALRLLPAGAKEAGRVSHPLEERRLCTAHVELGRHRLTEIAGPMIHFRSIWQAGRLSLVTQLRYPIGARRNRHLAKRRHFFFLKHPLPRPTQGRGTSIPR